MAKFCIYCGKELADRESCDCPASVRNRAKKQEKDYSAQPKQAYAAKNPVFRLRPNPVARYFDKLKNLLKNIAKWPALEIMRFSGSPDLTLSITLIAVKALVLAFFLLILGDKINASLENIWSMFGNVNLLTIFFVPLFMSLIVSFAFAGVVFLFCRHVLRMYDTKYLKMLGIPCPL